MISSLLTVLAVPFLSLHYVQQFFSSGPVVALDYASLQGSSQDGIASFLGIPFAAPPVGPLRFAGPQPPVKVNAILQATKYGPGCPPQALVVNPKVGIPLGRTDPDDISEDCLSLNVYKPANTHAGAKLPVVFFIHGGGFALGNSGVMDSGIQVVNRSMSLGHPVVYVSTNYRNNAFGFLASKEVQEGGTVNAGLHDQRFALQWAQKYISAFGGDPEKVTVIGVSAGSISIGLHMIANGGDLQGLFRGAIMESGSPALLGGISDAQPYYDQLVSLTECTTASDTLTCLREVPLDKMIAAVNKTPNLLGYSSIKLPWQPRTDGVLFTEEPPTSLANGKYAKIPFITGDDDDEGTLFALSSVNVTTNEEFLEYASYITGVDATQLAQIGKHYPDDQTQGSPFETGEAWQISPQYKRIAALTGDWIWQSTRRNILKATNGTQRTWSYIFRMGKKESFLGSVHAGSVGYFGASPNGHDFIINFAYNLDPNAAVAEDGALPVTWPEWNSDAEGALLTFSDPDIIHVTSDSFRKDALEALSGIQMDIAQKNNGMEGV